MTGRSTPNKLTATDRVLLMWALEHGWASRSQAARVFGISEARVYQIQSEHRAAQS